jgi:type I protein arginine methyltransferase
MATPAPMPIKLLQSLTAGFFSTIRRIYDASADWIDDRPRLAAWFQHPAAPGSAYRTHNGRMFADYHEQERMLADQPRMNFYHAAISRYIHPGDRVIDLGTGTGILAAFAARQGADKVYALDHSAIIKDAQILATDNQVEAVEFVATHSTAFTGIEPVDVILHEQMGDGLFDEDMVANVTDLRDRLLKPGGRIIPSNFEFYCEPVKIHDHRCVPFIWELNVHGYDYSALDRHRPQESSYYQMTSCDQNLVECFLGQPTPVLTMDLHTIEESALPHEIVFSRTILRSGRLDGFAIYFRTSVDVDLSLSSNPIDPQRAPHWGFRILRTEQAEFTQGDEIRITLTVGQWPDSDTWRWRYEKLPAA